MLQNGVDYDETIPTFCQFHYKGSSKVLQIKCMGASSPNNSLTNSHDKLRKSPNFYRVVPKCLKKSVDHVESIRSILPSHYGGPYERFAKIVPKSQFT